MKIKSSSSVPDANRLDKVVAEARRARDQRADGYRERALNMFPWVCGRCGRSFRRENVRELTVHHRDGDHDNNPPDGSNWELLCIYCHDNEHRRYEDHVAAGGRKLTGEGENRPSQRPFADLKRLLNDDGSN